MASRIGVDVGGTFTDVAAYDAQSRTVRLAKGPSVAEAPDEGVLALVESGLDAPLRARTTLFMHGTTVGLNALLERRGATVGLLVTRGFRDVLALRRGDRDRIYDVTWQPPPPLVPRRLRLPVTERVRPSGAVETPLDPADIARALERFAELDVEAIAVAYLHAYANPAHELVTEELLRAAGWDGEISLSHRLSGEYREYERTSTAVVDAYIRPQVASYLRRLERGLRAVSVAGECFITRSGGGVMRFEEAATRPFESIMSGPVAGAIGAGRLCAALGVEQGITADVGGTSFDTCLIVDGRPTVKFEGDVGGMPLQTPWVDVRSIGAGGGSIAQLDVAGRLRVGPESAGARPGPVAYGRGGTQPTVTDAAAVLGMFAAADLAGGLQLDVGAARAAVETLARRAGLSADALARGIIEVAVAAMGDAMRSITIEQGEDPRGAHLVAFGGAGPLLSTLLARELDIPRVIVPPYAGNFSAWGLLDQDVARSRSRTLVRRLAPAAVSEASRLATELFAALVERAPDVELGGPLAQEVTLDLRYLGQEHTLNVAVAWDGRTIETDLDAVAARFHDGYRRTFGTALDEEVEVVAVRATSRLPLPALTVQQPDGGAARQAARTAEAFSFVEDRFTTFAVLDRDGLSAGDVLEGPMVITEETSITYVDAGFRLEVHPSGALVLTWTEEGR